MNICILAHRYPYKDNMVHVFVKKLVDEWAKMGHTCVVISPLSMVHAFAGKERKAPKFYHYNVESGNEVKVYRPRYYTIPKIRFAGVSMDGFIRKYCIEKAIRNSKVQFDVIYCHFYLMVPSVYQYASENRIPLFVATGESSIPPVVKPNRSFSVKEMTKSLYGVIAVSGKNRNEAISLGYACENDIEVFPNGTNLNVFKKLDKQFCRKQIGLPMDKFIIICVGQFVERKGQKRILSAIDKLHNETIKTIFIGKGDLLFEHESILFKGSISNSELPLYLNAADVFVLPTRSEGCCNAIIEALACGLPIISSDRLFNYDVLSKENSILVEPDDIAAIAEAIDRLFNDKELFASLAKKSHEMGLKLSIEQRAKNILTFMQEKIQRRRKR